MILGKLQNEIVSHRWGFGNNNSSYGSLDVACRYNTASGYYSSVSGGTTRIVGGCYD